MQLPVLFWHELESGFVSRTKQYEIRAHHFLVEVEDDAKVFIGQNLRYVTEGVAATERFAQLALVDVEKVVNADVATVVSDVNETVKPKQQTKRAANKKDEQAAE